MNLLSSRGALARSAGVYLFTAAFSVLMVYTVFGFKREAVRLPFTYQGDTMFYHLLVKGMVDHGWFLDNPSLAAPGALDLRDVPSSDNNFYFLLLKLIALLKPMYPQVMNAFYLLSFPLVAVCALFVFRRFGVSTPVAVFASLLYAFLPYHFTRGQHHLFLSAYYFVPFALMIALWIGRDELPWRGWKLPFSLLVCVVTGATGYYYAFFACFFLLAAGLVAAVRLTRIRPLLLPAGLIAVIFGSVALNFGPSITRFSAQGDVQFVRRQAGEADVYGLRIAQLLLPIRSHRLAALSDLKVDYNMRLLINENDDASLGAVASLGFLGLLGWLLLKKPETSRLNADGRAGLLHHLSLLNGAALLLGTIGGLGSLVAFFGLPQVRAYNRLSIFIAFFSVFAVALWLDEWTETRLSSNARRAAFGAVLGLLLALALLDQVSPRLLPDYRRAEDEFMSDEVFVKQIETRLPPGSMVFQLPIVSFPENPKVHRMNDYDLVRGYLHSTHLRWSYGAIKGRENDVWQRLIAAKPTKDMLETLAWAGFSGLYLDRFGIPDHGEQMERDLRELLGAMPIVSPNDRLVFFDLRPYAQTLAAATPATEHAARREAALHPILAVWQAGFSDQEGTATDYWRWCGATGQMQIVNRTRRAQTVHVDITFSADYGGTVWMESPFFSESIRVDWKGQRFEKTIVVPPGEHPVSFRSDARRILPPNDFRDLVFRVRNFKLIAVDQQALTKATGIEN